MFDDDQLANLINSALDSNLNLVSGWHRLKAARAVVDRASSSLLPDLEASFQGELNKPQLAFEEFQQNQNVQLGLSSVYEIDLWGRIRAQIAAERYRARANFHDYKAAAITISAEVTRAWYQLMEAHSQLELVNEQISTNQKMVKSLRTRYGSGMVRATDILRQEQLLKSTREQKVQIQTDIELLEHRLLLLTGRIPQSELVYNANSLPELPALPKTGLPVQLVRRRPDVESAFNRVQAADREVAAAISNQYPRLSLRLSVSTATNEADNMFRNWAHSLVGSVMAPIFYGGRLSAEVDRTKAVKSQLLYEYGQTVLVAFQEVEDALVQEQNQLTSIELIEQQVDLASKTYRQLRIEYFNGLGDYLDVLTAQDRLQQLRQDLLSQRMLLLEYRISLYRALAGGYETELESNNS